MRKGSLSLCTLAAACILLSAGCAAKHPFIHPGAVRIEGLEQRFAAGEIIDLRNGKVVSFDELMAAIREKDLIFVGEVHNNPAHHLVQAQILQRLTEEASSPVAAMEFFQVGQQAVLDEYTAGGMDETTFLQKVDWNNEWGFPYFYYRPVVDRIREKRGRILAINAPAEIVRKVAHSGLESLDSQERGKIASEIDLDNPEHRAFVSSVFPLHAKQGDAGMFERFYQAQCVWEDTMAENIAWYMRANPGVRVTAFAGNGHLVYQFGIPARTVKRVPVKMVTVLPYTVSPDLELSRGLADFVWLTGE